ncbi:cation transporter [Microcella sp.]|uniref:cation transporter n=1 Tax=Microcella sp. TaxID=1913979 RepID=UPI00256539A8|nr:cation transporter [Microcella sp.]MBX9471576.1 cation transporter [Microcella sp.]
MTALSTREGSAANPERTALLRRRVRLLVAFTIGYNLIEGIIALVAGAAADSAALIAFGLDSGVEVLSAAAVAWQFSRFDPERYEKPTLRVIAFAFFALAAYTIISSTLSLIGSADPQPSAVGIALASISVVVMPAVSIIQRRTGRALGSATVVADSKQTLICSLLSGAVLLGLVANALFGWGWADAVAALVIGAFAIREGVEAWNGDTCARPIGELIESRGEPGDAGTDDCC